MDRDQAIKLLHDSCVVDGKSSLDLFSPQPFPPAISSTVGNPPAERAALTPEHRRHWSARIMNDRQTKEFRCAKECKLRLAPPASAPSRVSAFCPTGRRRLRDPSVSQDRVLKSFSIDKKKTRPS